VRPGRRLCSWEDGLRGFDPDQRCGCRGHGLIATGCPWGSGEVMKGSRRNQPPRRQGGRRRRRSTTVDSRSLGMLPCAGRRYWCTKCWQQCSSLRAGATERACGVSPTGGVGGFPGPLWRGNSGRCVADGVRGRWCSVSFFLFLDQVRHRTGARAAWRSGIPRGRGKPWAGGHPL